MRPSDVPQVIQRLRGGWPAMEIVEGMAELWYEALGDLRTEDVMAALVRMVRRSEAYPSIHAVRAEVLKLRGERLDATPLPQPPPDLPDGPGAYAAWLRGTRRAIADGTFTPPPALPAPPRRLELDGVFRRVPKVTP